MWDDNSFIENGRHYESILSLDGTTLRDLVENYGMDATIDLIVGQGSAWVWIGDDNEEDI